jgi:hypothetical protein
MTGRMHQSETLKEIMKSYPRRNVSVDIYYTENCVAVTTMNAKSFSPLVKPIPHVGNLTDQLAEFTSSKEHIFLIYSDTISIFGSGVDVRIVPYIGNACVYIHNKSLQSLTISPCKYGGR